MTYSAEALSKLDTLMVMTAKCVLLLSQLLPCCTLMLCRDTSAKLKVKHSVTERPVRHVAEGLHVKQHGAISHLNIRAGM